MAGGRVPVLHGEAARRVRVIDHPHHACDKAFGNQLDAWASGLGDWGECEADDDDDFDEPSAWRDSVALDDCDA